MTRYMLPNADSSIIYSCQEMEATKCPSTGERIKMWCTHTREYYSTIKKNEILPFATMGMDLEGIMLSE